MRFNTTAWLNSLAFKIFLAFVAGVILSIGLLVLFGALVRDRLPGMELPDRTRHLAHMLKFDAAGRPIGLNTGAEHPPWIYDSLSQETAYRVLDEHGNVVLASPGAERWPVQNDLSDLQRRRFEFTQNGVLHDGATEPFERQGRTWFVQLTATSRIIEFLHQEFALPFIRLGVITFSLVLLFVFGLCTYISLKYSLRPLRDASLAAAAISPRSLGQRLQTDRSPSEIVPLITSFNLALDQLEQGYRLQQEFLAKAAHELKTPLTLIRAEIELMDDVPETRTALLAQVEHLARHVQQLLLLAEASEPLSYQFAAVNLQEMTQDCMAFLQRIADDANVRLTCHGSPQTVRWQADRGALFTLLKNLVENAIQHAPPGTAVDIYVTADKLFVRDRGPGVSADQLPLLFSRFWRGAHRRDHGAGLGLAICQEIALAHGWTLSAQNTYPGLMMKVHLPSSDVLNNTSAS